jgi:hypothetical protein
MYLEYHDNDISSRGNFTFICFCQVHSLLYTSEPLCYTALVSAVLILHMLSGQIATIVIAHKDRLARFGVELIQHLCDVRGTTLLVLNTQTREQEQELVQDLLAIVDCFEKRLYGLRSYRKALKKALADAARSQNPAQSDA